MRTLDSWAGGESEDGIGLKSQLTPAPLDPSRLTTFEFALSYAAHGAVPFEDVRLAYQQ